MDPTTRLLLNNLHNVQEQVRQTCDGVNSDCETDVRYAQEWHSLRDFVDVAISNIDAAMSSGYPEGQLRSMILQVTALTEQTGGALLEGYLLDLASCKEDGTRACPLAGRAREALEARRLLREEYHGKQDTQE